MPFTNEDRTPAEEEMSNQQAEMPAEETENPENPETVEDTVAENSEQDTQADIEELTTKLSESSERIKRLQADFENFRRRTRQEKEELSSMVVQDFIKDLLPMLDNFDRAIAAEATDAVQFQQGVDMIYKQLAEVLKNKGLEPIETTDTKFDPNYHQAVMRVENPDLEDDTIAMELQKGYMVKGKVIRPSMVQVVANS